MIKLMNALKNKGFNVEMGNNGMSIFVSLTSRKVSELEVKIAIGFVGTVRSFENGVIVS